MQPGTTHVNSVALHQKVNSFIRRRRDAVVSRAVWKKFTDLQRVLNFRKIRIFYRFRVSHNFTQNFTWPKNGKGCQSLSFGAIFVVLSRAFMFFQVALARTSRITPSPVAAQVHFFTLRFTARNAKTAKFLSVFDIFSKFFRGNDPGENVHGSRKFHTATMKNGGHDISH